MQTCDPVTGACLLPETDTPGHAAPNSTTNPITVRYVGDPMCSWCWGISPTIEAVAAHCAAEGFAFAITVGGLRAGGGDPWNAQFKAFLRNEWRHIAQVTGQPFGYTLLDLQHFDYDTEPACRAVVTIQDMESLQAVAPGTPLRFFAAVQRKFYVDGEDTKQSEFYASVCAALGVDFEAFRRQFESDEARRRVNEEFGRCRRLGVRSFPTLLLERAGVVTPLGVGYVTTEQAIERLREAIAAA